MSNSGSGTGSSPPRAIGGSPKTGLISCGRYLLLLPLIAYLRTTGFILTLGVYLRKYLVYSLSLSPSVTSAALK